MFHVRDDRLLTAFPLSASAEFGTHPSLIGSRTPVEIVTAERERRDNGECETGDRIFLATDALAQWFLKQHEEKRQPWHTVLAVCQQSTDAFADWIKTMRDLRDIRNDDVTLVVIDI